MYTLYIYFIAPMFPSCLFCYYFVLNFELDDVITVTSHSPCRDVINQIYFLSSLSIFLPRACYMSPFNSSKREPNKYNADIMTPTSFFCTFHRAVFYHMFYFFHFFAFQLITLRPEDERRRKSFQFAQKYICFYILYTG